MSSKLDYLKRYMSKDDTDPTHSNKKKKKKSEKKSSKHAAGFRIIDSDSFSSRSEKKSSKKKKSEQFDEDDDEDDEKYATREEQPLVAGVVDERPREVIMREKFTTTGWQTSSIEKSQSKSSGFTIKSEPVSPEQQPTNSRSNDKLSSKRRHQDSESDTTPQRKRHHSSEDETPPRKRHDSDASPPRKRHDSDASSPRKRHDSDASPPRKRHDSGASPPRRRHDSDTSPPRKRHDSDASPHRKRHDSDASPPRRRHDSDASPPRRSRTNQSSSSRSGHNNLEIKQEPDDDLSPPRHTSQAQYDSDISPPRKPKEEPDSDLSPPRTSGRGADTQLMAKTLGGKKAGLQDAKSMKEEMINLKKKEKKNFEKLSSDISGRYAETKVRGRLKEKEAEAQAKKESEDKLRKELEEKYQKWNKGLKQLENEKERIQTALHEMDKPLARFKDDEDLDAHLRDVDRMEDPMLEYVKKKREKNIKTGGGGVAIPRYPQYKGPQPPPNRFGIRPGYRWDGVDRSTGFEKRLFEKANQRKAVAEEAYKWSTEDM